MHNNKQISIYSGITNEELNNLHEQLAFKYSDGLNDSVLIQKERCPEDLSAVKKKLSEKHNKEIYFVREFVKEYIFRELKELALIIYLGMRKCNDFGVMGEQRVAISFCRNIQGVPNNRQVNQFNADSFTRILDECDKRNGFKSGEEYLAYVKNYELQLLGKRYSCACLFELNTIFDLLKMNLRLFCTNSPYGVRFIFGTVEKYHIEGNKAYVVKSEYIRSPQFVLSVAAEVIDDYSIIRHEALEVIFFNKWQMFYEQSLAERKYALRNVNLTIREGIKEKVLNLYDAAKTEDVLRIKKHFIQNILNSTIWHEAGHRVSLMDMDPLHATFWNNFPEGEGAGTVLIEALADWAPAKGKSKGTFSYFAELAATNPKQADRELYMYMSDNWFVDDEEEFMSLMSNVLVGLAIFFINTDGSADFERLNKEIEKIYALFQERYKIFLTKIFDVIYQAEYELDKHKLNYRELETEIYNMYQDSKNAMPLDELRRTPAFWINILGYLKKFSQEGWKTYQKIIDKEGEILEQLILKKVSNDNMEKYNHSLREYIVRRAKETGIIGNTVSY
jgi:hypothetical protein